MALATYTHKGVDITFDPNAGKFYIDDKHEGRVWFSSIDSAKRRIDRDQKVVVDVPFDGFVRDYEGLRKVRIVGTRRQPKRRWTAARTDWLDSRGNRISKVIRSTSEVEAAAKAMEEERKAYFDARNKADSAHRKRMAALWKGVPEGEPVPEKAGKGA